MYLLNELIEVPLSVDGAIWPIIAPDQPLNGLSLQTLDRVSAEETNASLTAITTRTPDADRLRQRHGIEDPGATVEDLQRQGYRFMGYDVADDWLYSGLMNCGYTPSEKPALKERFSNGLNEHGLFKERALAEGFQSDANDRVKEHAPFTVFGLWMR